MSIILIGPPTPRPDGSQNPSGLRSTFHESIIYGNDAASDIDAVALRDHVLPRALQDLSATEGDLERVNDAIALLCTEKERLEGKKQILDALVFQSRGRLSAIRRFPVEVLSLIFHSYCDDPQAHIFDLFCGPWVISEVCSSWRALVLSLPTLWTSFRFLDPGLCPIRWKSLLDIAMERAKNKPISLIFRGTTIDYEYPPSERDCLAYMLNHSSRWESVLMAVGDTLVKDLADARGHCPLLRSLHLDLPGGLDDIDDLPPIEIFGKATQLTFLSLELTEQFTVPLPLSALRTVKVHANNCPGFVRQMHEIMNAAEHLESLEMTYEEGCFQRSTDTFSPPIAYSNLRRLTMYTACCHGEWQFHFTAPKLQHLDVHYMEQNYGELLQCLKRSQCPLESISIQSTVGGSLLQPTLAIMDLLPSLRSISIKAEYHDEGQKRREDFDEFTRAMEGLVVFPKFPILAYFFVDFGHDQCKQRYR